MLVILNTTVNHAITYTNYVDMHMFTILGYLYVPFVVNNASLLELHTHIALGIFIRKCSVQPAANVLNGYLVVWDSSWSCAKVLQWQFIS